MASRNSAKKRARQAEVRRQRNREVKTRIKTMIKRVRLAVQQGDEASARDALAKVIPLLDKAARKGVIHPNNRARKISRLTRLVNTLSSTKA